ncbi:NHL domain-containing protein [Streptomyces sp. IBSNAI002]|uniref:NHL domain-containing protein n=1 Tax=Streptomyces sp. IBSNAI002 TaxID=3457500 RepID=UPI003FD367F7
MITTLAGTGVRGFRGDGTWAYLARLAAPQGVAAAPDGSVVFIDRTNNRVRRVGPSGVITTVAGTGDCGVGGDGGPAVEARLCYPCGLAVAPDGSVIISDTFVDRVRRVDPVGVITTIAGCRPAEPGAGAEGDPATRVRLSRPGAVAVAPDGSVLIAEPYRFRVLKVDPFGLVSLVAGSGAKGFGGDGGPARYARLGAVQGLAVAPDGSLLLADAGNRRIRRVDPAGVITTVAGNGRSADRGDGGPAAQASFTTLSGIAVAADGGVLVSDERAGRVRRVDPSGIITAFAGDGDQGFAGDGGPATRARLNYPHGVAVARDGGVVIADRMNHRLRHVGPES